MLAESVTGLLACRSRRDAVAGGKLVACVNPRVHAERGLISAAVCACCECREEPRSDDLYRDVSPFAAPVGAAAPAVLKNGASQNHVGTWAVGMTTAPRARPTIHKALASLAAGGWASPRLFAEPNTVVPEEFAHLPISGRDSALCAFPNWYLGLCELFFRDPHADAYLMCQDDALFATGSRELLEQTLWPAANVGVVSIYTPSHVSAGKSRGFHAERRGWASWGALAYIFPNASLRALLANPLFIDHRRHGPAEGLRNIDSVVGAWCELAGLPYFVYVPSLAQHIGETSTIWNDAGAVGRRRAADFMFDVARL
jgi:hypothetical protein